MEAQRSSPAKPVVPDIIVNLIGEAPAVSEPSSSRRILPYPALADVSPLWMSIITSRGVKALSYEPFLSQNSIVLPLVGEYSKLDALFVEVS